MFFESCRCLKTSTGVLEGAASFTAQGRHNWSREQSYLVIRFRSHQYSPTTACISSLRLVRLYCRQSHRDKPAHYLHAIVEAVVLVPSLVPWFARVYESQIGANPDHVGRVVVHCRSMDLTPIRDMEQLGRAYVPRKGCVRQRLQLRMKLLATFC